MTKYGHILYARGFLVGRGDSPKVPAHWNTISFGNWNFWHDPVTTVGCTETVLIHGHCIDPAEETSDLQHIAERVASTQGTGRQNLIDSLAGRFVILQREHDNLEIQADAVGLRSVYYTEIAHEFWAGSHEHLVAVQVNAPRNYFAGGFLSENRMNAYPGRATGYLAVSCLLANSSLESNTRATSRIFPRSPFEPTSSEDAATTIIESVDAQLRALPESIPLLTSLTAGMDSRISLALLRDISDRIKFFAYELTYKKPNAASRHDRKMAQTLASDLGLRHEMLEIHEPSTDRAFVMTMLKNSSFPHSRAVARAYYEMAPENALHIRSNTYELGRDGSFRIQDVDTSVLNPKVMRHLASKGQSEDPAALDSFAEYMAASKFGDIEEYGYDPVDLFYWDYRLAQWLAHVVLESDIAMDTHILINSRSVLRSLISVPLAERMAGVPYLA